VQSILIVDDSDADRDGMAEFLRGEGFEVATATDGQDALGILETARFDLVLLDMVMHTGFDGWFFLGQLKHRADGVRVLIVTGLPIANETWAVSLGAGGCLKKPFEAERLLEEVQRLTLR
jgi:CheY-like chemotaxis protein